MKKLVLIDGNAIVHRAYHALPPLTRNEQQVNAVYGFFLMLLRILTDVKPNYLIVCFDRPKPTFRKALYVGYQATRPQMENELSSQFKIIHEALDRAKVEIFEIDGYEADDLIGTISEKAVVEEKEELEVIIVTGDRDMLQLVNSHVSVLAPIVGVTKMILFDHDKVVEKYGLKPEQIVDYKALVGDSSDNYPGVAGIGPKTASNLLNKYGDFETLYKNLSELPDKLSGKLATDAEQAALAKKLAQIVKDAPLELDLKKSHLSNFDSAELKKFFAKLGFKSLQDRIPVFPKEEGKQLELI